MSADQSHEAGYQVMVRALKFRCTQVPVIRAHSVWLWAATRTGQVEVYQDRRKRETVTPQSRQIESQVGAEVRDVLGWSPAEQARWIRSTLNSSCTASSA